MLCWGVQVTEGTCDCGYRNCPKPQSWGLAWAWEAKLLPLTLLSGISENLMQPVEQETGLGGWGNTTPAAVAAHSTLYVVKAASQLRAEPLYPTCSLRRMPRKAKAAPQRIPTA